MSRSFAMFIDPPSHHFLGDRLFRADAARHGGEDLMAPHIAVREHFAAHDIPVHTVDLITEVPADQKLVISLGRTNGHDVEPPPGVIRSAFIAMECPIVEPGLYRRLPAMARAFRRVYSWTDGESLLPFTRSLVRPLRFWWPQSFDAARAELWSRDARDFLVMINANKLPRLYDRELYTARLDAVRFFQQHGEVALFGKGWGGMPMRVGYSPVPASLRRAYAWAWQQWQHVQPHPVYRAARAAWRGPVDSKLDALSRFRFALCFENMALKGWMTEKLFDCLCAGTVPVYWGAPDVAEWVDPECFIDMRQFEGFAELRRFLHQLSPADVQRHREAGRAFLASARFDRFRRTAWVDLFRTLAAEDAGVDT